MAQLTVAPAPGARTEIDRREAAHWDNVARTLRDEDLRPPVLSEADKIRLDLCGDLRGKRVLDVGCGSGAWAVILAQRGASVSAIDISPEMVAVTRRRAELAGVADRVAARTMSAMELDYTSGFFDCVHGQDIVHHLEPGLFGHEIARVLAEGGRAVFRENSGNNGLLMLARNTLCGRFGISKWSSDDEYPLTPRRRKDFSRNFASTRVEYPEFVMFHYVDAKFFRYRVKAVTKLCRALDRAMYAVPFLRRLSYRQLIACTR